MFNVFPLDSDFDSTLRLLGLGAGLTALSSRQWTPVGVYLAREERCLPCGGSV